ncbi:MAG: hypothetical protein SGI96_02005 [Bacteroidota bacterium]|nr:hypothetical protein [Bacteroidota bacterium]
MPVLLYKMAKDNGTLSESNPMAIGFRLTHYSISSFLQSPDTTYRQCTIHTATSSSTNHTIWFHNL